MANTNGVNGVNGHDISPIVTVDEFLKHEYDYLVLGGGTAGLTVAARLAEDPQVCVGVLEAGKDKTRDMLVNTPAMFPQMFGNPEYEWNYMSVSMEEVLRIKQNYEISACQRRFNMLTQNRRHRSLTKVQKLITLFVARCLEVALPSITCCKEVTHFLDQN